MIDETFTEEEHIFFELEQVDFKLAQPEQLISWIKSVLEKEQKELIQLTFIFCSDDYLIEINQEYLDHNTYTDIITFPYLEPPLIEGDIFISIDRVAENARQYQVSFEQELHRVMIHGVLHLCGYLDKTEEEASKMRAKENEALGLLKV
jgi:probable rRNA maturation factor